MVSKAYILIARGTIRLSSQAKEVQEEWDLGEGSAGTCHVSYSRHNLHHLFCSFPLPCCESLLNFGFCPTHPVPVVVSCGNFLVRLSRPLRFTLVSTPSMPPAPPLRPSRIISNKSHNPRPPLALYMRFRASTKPVFCSLVANQV